MKKANILIAWTIDTAHYEFKLERTRAGNRELRWSIFATPVDRRRDVLKGKLWFNLQLRIPEAKARELTRELNEYVFVLGFRPNDEAPGS